MKKNKIAYRILLQLFNPLLLILIGIAFCIETDSYLQLLPFRLKLYLYLLSFIAIYLIPLASLPILRNIGSISDYALTQHRERLFPAIALLLGLYFSFRTLNDLQLPIPQNLNNYLIVLIILTVFFGVISYFWKINPRALVFGLLFGFISVQSLLLHINASWILIAIVLVAGILFTLQLFYASSKPKEILAALFSGLFAGLVLLFF